jgi:serine/threonine protein kinase
MATPTRKAGRYELQEELGRGAMGVVFKALDPLIGRIVAVKTMRLEEMGGNTPRPELLTRFHTETRAAGLLSHPNIVVIYDAGTDEDLYYITMEYVAGRSLLAMMEERQAFPLPRLLRLMEQACKALDYAHQRNIVHRDVKPANILLAELDTVKITDFGTAKILEIGGTQTGHIIGTPSYMSPEQVKGRPVDGRADVFSLGVILYELVTGEKPFPGKNVTTVIYKIVNEEPIPPIDLDASLHPGLNAVINKGLAKEPEDRFQSCGELLNALRTYREVSLSQSPTLVLRAPALGREALSSLRSGGPETTPLPRAIPVVTPASTPVPAPVAAAPPAPRTLYQAPPKEKKTGQIWLALFLFVVLGVAGYYSWPQFQDLFQRSEPLVTRPRPAQPPAPAAGGGGETGDAGTNAAGDANNSPLQPAEKAGGKNSARSAEKPPAKTGRPDSSPAPANLADVKAQFEKRLAGEGFADQVQVTTLGSALVLTGSLTKADHRRLQKVLAGLPAKTRVTDKIQLAKAAPGDEEKPRTAPGKGEIEVVTDVLGARAMLNGPTGAAVSDCRTPCRFEELAPGRYTMDLELDGYRPIKRILQVRAGNIETERLTLQPLASSLVVGSRPAGATVTVNGQRQSQVTPATISLSPGHYSIVIEKAGYERYANAVDLKSDSVMHVEVQLVAQRGGTGTLEVRTIPMGADILINNISTGRRTPARLELPAGQCTVTLYLKGYAPLERTVTVQGDHPLEINETLVRP